MNTPYGLEIVENCLSCRHRKGECFSQLSPPVLKGFSAISHQTTYPGKATLFVEGQSPRGVFLLCAGKVKLSTTSRDGKVLIFKMAGPGDLLGLSAVISGTAYEMTAETAVPCHLNYVQREPLLALLERHGEAGLRAAQMLSREFQAAVPGHPRLDPGPVFSKAAALLDSSRGQRCQGDSRALRADARRDGADDWRVARDGDPFVERFEKEAMIRLGGSTLVIPNRMALEALVS